MTHGHEHDAEGRGHHGPAHPGDSGSAEPGGFDEFDHPDFADIAAAAAASLREEQPEGTGIPVVSDGTAAQGDGAEPALAPLTGDAALAAERLEDLRRLQAEYVNYKKRVDRDRDLARQAGVERVLTDFLPVLDSIALAKQHDDVAGGFKLVADELEKVTTRHGLVAFGEVGDAFDPVRHDALMAVPMDEPVEVVTVSQVMQQGYELGGRVIRPARVAVANP